MKVNLLLNNRKKILNGYTNLDMFADGQDIRIKEDIMQLNSVADGECSELIVSGILSYFPQKAVGNILLRYLKKITLGCNIIIQDIDFEIAAFNFVYGKMNSKDFVKLMWGEQTQDWDGRKSGLSMSMIIEFLESANFKVIKRRYVENEFVIEATRLQ